MKAAIYAGSFDPLTYGHLWVIEKGLSLFDNLVVALGVNTMKKSTFSVEDRLEILNSAIARSNVEITSYEDELLVNSTIFNEINHIMDAISKSLLRGDKIIDFHLCLCRNLRSFLLHFGLSFLSGLVAKTFLMRSMYSTRGLRRFLFSSNFSISFSQKISKSS